MLSVVILNYNGKEILFRCLESVKNQSFTPAEVIVIDNASSDESWRIAQDFDYRIIHTDNNLRLITGLNKALSLCKEWLFFMAQDVILKKNCLEEMMKYQLDKKAIYQPVFYNIDGSINNAGMDLMWPGYGKGRLKKWWKGNLPQECGIVTDIAFLIHKEGIGAARYDENFVPGYYEDIDWGLRFLGKQYLIPSAEAIHHSNYSYSKVFKKSQLSGFCHINRQKLIKKHFKGLDKWIRLAMTRVLDIMKKPFDVITDWRVSQNEFK